MIEHRHRLGAGKVDQPTEAAIGAFGRQGLHANPRLVNYITMASVRKTTSHGGNGALPPTMEYFKKMGERLNDAKASSEGRIWLEAYSPTATVVIP
jgi:hypothetical protein